LKASATAVAGFSFGMPSFAYADDVNRKIKLRFGIVTDIHSSDGDTEGIRCFRESEAKLAECVALMNEKKVDFMVELGDFVHEYKPASRKTGKIRLASEKITLNGLQKIEKIFGTFNGKRYHVIGNHDLVDLSKEQFLSRVENTGITGKSGYYSFDVKGLHVVVLDANYREDGSDYDHGNFDWIDNNIPSKELSWLESNLESASNPAVIFIHQPLDGAWKHTVNNAPQVRQVLQKSKKVLAVFQGHNHYGNYSGFSGIHFYTLRALLDGSGSEYNSYAVVEVMDDYSIMVTGYRRAETRQLLYSPPA
jgi:predicted phosphodiesterase